MLPPQIAALLCVVFMAWLFRRDFRERPNVTSALWLPFFWIMVSGSRFFSEWLGIFGLNWGGGSVQEGSPLDATFFFVIIAGGLYVLKQRQVNWGEFIRHNRWVAIYLGYCLLACLWSDYPLVSAKRWVKLFGQPVMVLVLLTEPEPLEALTRLLKRFAYVIVPVSILFIKYFPDLGSAYDAWTGQRMNTGIATDKNVLGCDGFILALFFVWHFQRVWQWEKGLARRNELILCAAFMGPVLWLLYMAHSASPIGALAMALAMMWFLGLKSVNPYRLGSYLVVGGLVLGAAQYFFHIHEIIIHALGRSTNLTGRTEIWDILLHWDLNPFLGVGFESFWLGPRLDELAVMLPGLSLNEAHNGYLETYIQIGGLGVGITLAMLLATYFKTHRALLNDFAFGRFRLAYLAAFIVYNFTEALFRTHGLQFFLFFLIAIDYPARDPVESANADIPESDADAARVHKTSMAADGFMG